MLDDVLAIKKVAVPLMLGDRNACSIGHRGVLPAFKMRGVRLRQRADFNSWLAERAENCSDHRKDRSERRQSELDH